MRAIILDIPTTPIFATPEFSNVSDELKNYRLHDQKLKLEDKFGIRFSPPNSYNRGLLFIAAVLEQQKIKVTYYNADYDNNFWEECKKKLKNSDIILASAKTNNYPLVLNFLKEAKNINGKILTIIGGSHPTALPRECLRNKAIDYIVMGEGEETIKEFINILTKKRKNDFRDVVGLAFKENGKIYINKLRPLIPNLDNLPMPAYHLLPGDLKSYHVYIDTSRGCSYECGFCSGPGYWQRKIRTRSFKNFYRELLLIKSLIGNYNFLHISDPMFGITDRQIEIIKELSKIRHNLFFSCDVKANYIKQDLIKTMIDCGVRIFSIGIETLNQKSLELIKKNCSAEKEIEACQIIKKFPTAFIKSYWIFGLPGENKLSLRYNNKQIYRLLKNGIVDQICSHLLVPYPGTEFFNFPEKFGISIINKSWSCYEGRSYPLVYNLNNLTGRDIYKYFIQAHQEELSYYKEKYPELKIKKNGVIQKKLSFSRYKGRLV